jgi:tRNA modification GTPase
MITDTIAAVSTGMTPSGIGKVRLSGTSAIEIVDKLYRSPKSVISHDKLRIYI